MGNTLSSCSCLEHKILLKNNALDLDQLLKQEEKEQEKQVHLKIKRIGCLNCKKYGNYDDSYCTLDCKHSHRYRYEPLWKYFIYKKLNIILYFDRVKNLKKCNLYL